MKSSGARRRYPGRALLYFHAIDPGTRRKYFWIINQQQLNDMKKLTKKQQAQVKAGGPFLQ